VNEWMNKELRKHWP